MEPQDCLDADQDIKRLFAWVEKHGGKHRVYVQQDKHGVRGLYSAQAFNSDPEEQARKKKEVEAGVVNRMETDEEDVVIKVPNRLLVTPYHIGVREAGYGKDTYKEIFAGTRDLFDPK